MLKRLVDPITLNQVELRGITVYGIWFYSSRAMRMMRKQFMEFNAESNWVYNFKTHGQHFPEVRVIMDAVADRFDCQEVIALPSSKKEETPNMQKVLGKKLIRVYSIQSRKDYRKGKSRRVNLSDSFQLIEPLKEDVKRVLLVDDICSTGKTMSEAVEAMERDAKGISVVPFVLAFSHFIKDQTTAVPGTIYIYYQEQEKKAKPAGGLDLGLNYDEMSELLGL